MDKGALVGREPSHCRVHVLRQPRALLRERKQEPVEPDATQPGQPTVPGPAGGGSGANTPGNGGPVVISPTSPTAQVAGLPGNEPFGNS